MTEQPKNKEVKRRKIRQSDWRKVEEFLKKELDKRKGSNFRKSAETKWAEIDRQIAMEPMKKLLPGGKEAPQTWESSFELGELSKASEVIAADVMRLVFPSNRSWLECHVKPPQTYDETTGKQVINVSQKKQKAADGALRSLMAQQHMDFGLKARVKLSVKEALHHGGFVTTVEWEHQNKVYDGQGLQSLEAPVWVPHSMWNAYPDMSPSVVPGAIFYQGSMMVTSYMPRFKVLQLSGEGYMNIDPNKIPKRTNKNKDVDTEDVELLTYYGDLNIEREDGDIYLPNSKCMTANGTVIYYRANPLPFPEVIYAGYERQDVRDPYFTSPIIKNSPMQKVATILANKFIDGVDLHIRPPGSYDGNDPYLVATGGPVIAPGVMTATKGSGKVTFMEVGDPKAALMGLQLALTKLEEGTAVNAIRSGADDSDRKTATEVQKTAQGAEVRTVDFVGDLEPTALRPFLYMQHELNLQRMESYSFYCQEKGLPDFLTMKKKDLPKIVHFEIVGSKGILGEERRAQQMIATTQLWLSNPLTAQLLNLPVIMIDGYEDAGVKGAEEYIKTGQPQIPPQAQAQIQQLTQALQECQQELQKAKAGEEVQLRKIELDRKKAEAELATERARLEMEKAKAMQDVKIDATEVVNKANLAIKELDLQRQEMERKYALEVLSVRREFAVKEEAARLKAENDKKETDAKIENMRAEAKARRATVKLKRTADGYEASES